MKRTAIEDVETVSKRSRTEPNGSEDLFNEALQRSATELTESLENDTGNIQGQVHMIWPQKGGLRRIVFEMNTDETISRFHVEISEKCLRGVNAPNFKVHDVLCFALKGAKVELRAASSAPYSLPLAVKYADGVAVKFISRAVGQKPGDINTWAGVGSHKEHDWYSTPANPRAIPTISDVVREDAFESGHDGIRPPLPDTRSRITPDHAPPESHSNNVNPIHDTSPVVDQIPESLDHASVYGQTRPDGVSKKQWKRLKQKERNIRKPSPKVQASKSASLSSCSDQNSNAVIFPPPVPERSPLVPPPQQLQPIQDHHQPSEVSQLPESGPSSGNPSSESRIPPTEPDSAPVDTVPVPAPIDPALHIRAGLRTEVDSYVAVGKIKENRGLINAIAVVTSARTPSLTRSNEWGCSFDIVDPSSVMNPESPYIDSSNHISVNCFQKKYVEWLPAVKQGDIVILRKLKVTQFQGRPSVVGYGDKLRWAAYDPEMRCIRPPNRGNAPEFEGGPDTIGYRYTPYWEPRADGDEINYCSKLADWWQELQKRGGDNITTIQCVKRSKRPHRLIADASPEMEPSGFFDCTVEILHVYQNDNGPYSVYVTDYTSNPRLHPIQTSWCPPELSTHVLKIEMWDAAANLARIMEPGDLWFMYNSRVVHNRHGFMEGKMQLDERVCKLDERNTDNQPHLEALIQRRREWTNSGGSTVHLSNEFGSKLIQDVDDKTGFFSCTVLHMDCSSPDEALAYVTDYTFHPDLPIIPSNKWGKGLDRHVVKVVLEGGQKRRAEKIIPGRFYAIKNLRLINRPPAHNIYGRLGGDEKLIFAADDPMSDDAKALFQRKERWKSEAQTGEAQPNESLQKPIAIPEVPLPARHNEGDATIKHIISSEACPSKFEVIARVVDFYPLSLQDAVILHCMKCDAE
ncbi:hypothetical protein BJ138DRAFT_1016657 [Hygrophoropsis aurantiaca]|uniref:Uncharacterized protein n=1 Tax=Hygrophoropsis aurantiaca TaxID=72124 RepID=A0ACB7ZZJ2_9AGAM|nr:hypothetical protein BJ138DRAFT_1016657 [Hygrophoropsis aurantiaca]